MALYESVNMKIAILGAGNVGNALAAGWLARGHDVVFGVRDLNKAPDAKATPMSVPDAARFAEVLVLAVPWGAVPDALHSAGSLTGKIVLDATNPLLPDLSGLDPHALPSGGEKVAELARVPVVKIFNTTGFPNMRNPDYRGEKATMFYCGDDAGAKTIAHALANDLGFEPIDAGPLRQARLLEPLALLWITLALKQGLGADIAFKLMRR
jgi:8-hydroxy-5-deazaflavin:NADPH oxidoreductase